jgi:DNA-binding CsgD family transcriptional regulator
VLSVWDNDATRSSSQCWLSPRTVAFHLRNVFAKTGVTSRAQLAQLALN